MKFGKILKKLKPLIKVAAPIAASFVPGGSIAMNVINRVQTARKVAAPALTMAKRLTAMKSSGKGRPGMPSFDARMSIQSDTNGTTGGVGYRHSAFLAASRARRYGGRSGSGIGTRYTYQRARAMRRPMPYKGRMTGYRMAR